MRIRRRRERLKRSKWRARARAAKSFASGFTEFGAAQQQQHTPAKGLCVLETGSGSIKEQATVLVIGLLEQTFRHTAQRARVRTHATLFERESSRLCLLLYLRFLARFELFLAFCQML